MFLLRGMRNLAALPGEGCDAAGLSKGALCLDLKLNHGNYQFWDCCVFGEHENFSGRQDRETCFVPQCTKHEYMKYCDDGKPDRGTPSSD